MDQEQPQPLSDQDIYKLSPDRIFEHYSKKLQCNVTVEKQLDNDVKQQQCKDNDVKQQQCNEVKATDIPVIDLQDFVKHQRADEKLKLICNQIKENDDDNDPHIIRLGNYEFTIKL